MWARTAAAIYTCYRPVSLLFQLARHVDKPADSNCYITV